MIETIATLITVLCGILSLIIAACTIDYYNHAGSIPALSTFINLKTIIMRAKKSIRAWVAREKNGALFLFCEKPKKRKSYWINLNTFNSLVLPKEAFPNVKWEDNEPTRVYIRIA